MSALPDVARGGLVLPDPASCCRDGPASSAITANIGWVDHADFHLVEC